MAYRALVIVHGGNLSAYPEKVAPVFVQGRHCPLQGSHGRDVKGPFDTFLECQAGYRHIDQLHCTSQLGSKFRTRSKDGQVTGFECHAVYNQQVGDESKLADTFR